MSDAVHNDERQQEREKYIKLISSDGVTIYLEKKAAMVSGTVKHLVTSDTAGDGKIIKEFPLSDISAPVLEKVCEYFHFKLRFQNTPTKLIPEFPLPAEYALDILKASNYLDT